MTVYKKLIEVQNGFITAENSTRESLVRQVENMKQNYQDLKTAIEQNPVALEFVSNRLKNDREIVYNSVSKVGWTTCYASDKLRGDKDLILAGVKVDGQILYYASKELRDDKDVVLEAVRNKGLILKYASHRMRRDKEIVLEAIKQDKRAKEYIASEELLNDSDVQAILNPPQE